MRNVFAVIALAALFVVPFAFAGERVVCKVWLDDGGIVARSTAPAPLDTIGGSRPGTAGLASVTLDGFACPANRLQPDGGIQAWDGGTGYEMTQANGQPTDGGVAGCPVCDFRGATSVAFQCLDSNGAGVKVYYSEQWDGGFDKWNQRGVMPATTSSTLVDFSINSDPYRIDFRGSAMPGQNQHVSVKPFAASQSAVCTFSTIKRASP